MPEFDYPEADESGRLSSADAEQLTVHLAELAGADLPLGPGLLAAADECTSRRLARALRGLAARVDRGESLEAAVSAEPRVLPKHIVRLVQAAAHSGRIGAALSELLEHHRAAQRLRRDVRAVLAYPLLLLVLLAGVFVLFAIFVAPDIAEMFEDLQMSLPAASQALVWFSRSGRWVVFGLLGAAPAVALLLAVTRLLGGSASLRRVLAAIPLIGPIWHWSGASELCRLMALLLEHRVQLPEALRLAAGGVSDADVGQTAARLASGVEAGRSLSGQLAAGAGLPDTLTLLVRWGEDHGALADAFRSASELFEERIRLRTMLIKTVLPPLVFIVIGIGAGFLLFAIVGPLLQLLQGLS